MRAGCWAEYVERNGNTRVLFPPRKRAGPLTDKWQRESRKRWKRFQIKERDARNNRGARIDKSIPFSICVTLRCSGKCNSVRCKAAKRARLTSQVRNVAN